ncbi:MAG TPA: hypothetical protein VGN73_02155 [Gemmatimonadaceae bacterium]|nr:hypothetical protein [Gemmatimonadaceae bacterium]
MSWRPEADKNGYKWEVPYSAEFFDTVKAFRKEIGAVAVSYSQLLTLLTESWTVTCSTNG